MTREDINKEALELSHDHNILALEWATGVGKSKAALDIAFEHYNPKGYKVLLVIAELAHIQNWEDEVVKWEYDYLYKNFDVVTYASLKHYIDKPYNMIILDEAHHIGSDLRLDILSKLVYDKLLLLSATLDLKVINSLDLQLTEKMYIHKVSLNEAIKYSILPKPQIKLVPLELSNRGDTEIYIQEWGKKKDRRTYKCNYTTRWEYMKNRRKYPNVRLEIACTPRQKYMMINDQVEYYKKRTFQTNNNAFRNKWMQLALERKRFLGEMKTKDVSEILKKYKDKRYICFCTSIEQADTLGGSNSIHSQMDDPQQVIDNFNMKKINSIFAVGMIKEGQNLVDVEIGFMIQLDGVIRPFIQKFGRSLRAKNPIQYIFYYPRTRDEEYLKNVLEELDYKYVKEHEV